MIPYNPSSFNSNKTILEQILELKNWLKDHPSYEIFYSSQNGSTLGYSGYLLSAISDSTNLEVGDVVIFSNVMVGVVISVDRDNGTYGCDACVSFKGDTGATGQQGYSLRVSSENYVDDVTAYHRNSLEPSHGTRENDTILFANGYVGIVTSLGAGATYYVTNRTVSFVGPQGPTGPQGPQGPQGPTGPQGVSITNVAIDGNQHLIVTLSSGSTIDAGSVASSLEGADIQSTGATSGQVLAADGSGGASWQNAGGGQEIVELTSASGTLTVEQATSIVNGAIIKYVRNANVSYYLYCYNRYTSAYYYSSINLNTNANNGVKCWGYFDTAGGRSYTISYIAGEKMVLAENMDSTGATSGQILTADGNGGASWQNAGGSVDIVEHNFTIDHIKGTITGHVYFQFTNNVNSSITARSSIANILYNGLMRDQSSSLTATGYAYDSSDNSVYVVVGIYASSSNIPTYIGYDITTHTVKIISVASGDSAFIYDKYRKVN